MICIVFHNISMIFNNSFMLICVCFVSWYIWQYFRIYHQSISQKKRALFSELLWNISQCFPIYFQKYVWKCLWCFCVLFRDIFDNISQYITRVFPPKNCVLFSEILWNILQRFSIYFQKYVWKYWWCKIVSSYLTIFHEISHVSVWHKLTYV